MIPVLIQKGVFIRQDIPRVGRLYGFIKLHVFWGKYDLKYAHIFTVFFRAPCEPQDRAKHHTVYYKAKLLKA